MTTPTSQVFKVGYQNPDASDGLTLSLHVLPNTPEDIIRNNVKENSREYPEWLQVQPEHDFPAVMIGGGDSINDHIDDIRELQAKGAKVFAMNAASLWALGHGIRVDYQVIVDAKRETAGLVDPFAGRHLFASQCDPETLARAANLTLWHLEAGDVEKELPKDRVKQGGYVLVGGDSTVGTCALCVAYTQGFRELHVFGYDSSHREGKSHGYPQPINETMPTMEMEWAGRKFQVSIAMRAQAEKFMVYAQALKDAGCTFHVYGDGLLQTIYNTDYSDLPEREKYQLMWHFDKYREVSPGEHITDFYLENIKPKGKIIDFGCGTGRAGVKMARLGYDVHLVDFTDNCRDEEALVFPFTQHDLTNPLPIKGPNGFCTDVMEHIPTDDIDKVIKNIMDATDQTFFQISLQDDDCGDMINQPLHLTVKPFAWWAEKFESLGYTVKMGMDLTLAAIFLVDSR